MFPKRLIFYAQNKMQLGYVNYKHAINKMCSKTHSENIYGSIVNVSSMLITTMTQYMLDQSFG